MKVPREVSATTHAGDGDAEGSDGVGDRETIEGVDEREGDADGDGDGDGKEQRWTRMRPDHPRYRRGV
jgi:hypothetical protein